MPKFKYTAYTPGNESMAVSDTVEAGDRTEATRTLIARGLQPISIEEIPEKGIDWNIQITPPKIKQQELAFFSRQLATLVGAGIPVLSSLEIAGRSAKKQAFRDAVEEIRHEITQGNQFSQALTKYPNFFDSLYISMIKAGESGDLVYSLQRLADTLEAQAQQKREIRGALAYPAVVSIVALVIMTAMLMFVVPAFKDIFEQAGGQLPAMTQMLVTASHALQNHFIIILGTFLGSIFGFRYWKKTDAGRLIWDKIKLSMPIGIGQLVIKVATARYSRTLSTLQKSGVPLLQCMEIAAPTAGNKVIENATREAAREVQNGRPLSSALRAADVFPDMAMSMLESGERAGRVGEMLNKVAETYELEVSNTIKSIKSIIEPVMIVGIGALIGVVVIALYMPMFSIYSTVDQNSNQ